MVQVRAALSSDAEVISAIAGEVQSLHATAHPDIFKPATGATFPPEAIARLISQPDHYWWVALLNGKVIGYAYAILHHLPETRWKHPSTILVLEQMGVSAADRRRGAGGALLAAVQKTAAARGAVEVRLQVWAFNESARRFYAHHGFAVMQEVWSLSPVKSGGEQGLTTA